MNELGDWLAEAREARGLTLEDAERDTRISRRYLHALEAGDLDVIPAPVYARGFLRSYAQYLGLDPQEAMGKYPREDGMNAPPEVRKQQQPPRRGTSPTASGTAAGDDGGRQNPFGNRGRQQARTPSPAPAAATEEPEPVHERPPWRRPGPVATSPDGAAMPSLPAPPRRQARQAAPIEDFSPGERYDDEPTIGAGFGTPVPARRIQQDPAAQTRSMVVLTVAVVVIGAVLVLAFAISRLGGDEGGGPAGEGAPGIEGAAVEDEADDDPPPDDGAGAEPGEGEGEPLATGIVPGVIGETEEAAIAAIESAGLVPNVRYEPDEGQPGIVLMQQPDAGSEREPGDEMTIIVSQEP